MQQVSPQRRAAALFDGRRDLELTQAQVPLLGLAPRRSVGTKDARKPTPGITRYWSYAGPDFTEIVAVQLTDSL